MGDKHPGDKHPGGRKRPGAGREAVDKIANAIEKRLFVGRLPAETTEEELRKVFEEFGEITECKKVEGKNVAFVGFVTWAAAHRAIKATDGKTSLEGHTERQALTASFSEQAKKVGRGGGAYYEKGLDNSRIFVGGLPEDCSEDDLRALFENYGIVEAVTLLPQKGHKRCGFVNYQLWGECLDAIEGIDNQQPFPDRVADEEMVTVVFADPKPGQDREEPGAKRRRSDDYNPQSSEFERAKAAYLAAVESTAPMSVCTELHWALMQLRPSERSWGNGGGGYGRERNVSQPSLYGERSAIPALAAPSRPKGSGNPHDDVDAARLFIGGLPVEIQDSELKALIDQLQLSGSPSDTEMLECRVLPGRGCGYIRFGSWAVAEEAIAALDERQVNGWAQSLRAKWAVPKEEQKPRSGGSSWGGSDQWSSRSGGGYSDRSSDYRRPREAAPRSRRDDAGSGEVEECRLFVGQVARGTRRGELEALFQPFGAIEELKHLEDKGVAYIQYVNADDAKQALQATNGQKVEGVSRDDKGLNVQFSKKR